MQRYMILNDQNQIVGGPCLWDGVTPWEPPAGCRVVLESEAIAAGYPDAPSEEPQQE